MEGHDIVAANRCWTLRLPLSTEQASWGYITFYRECGSAPLLLDINYLSNLFQRELAQAAERIFTRKWPEHAASALLASGERRLAHPLDL